MPICRFKTLNKGYLSVGTISIISKQSFNFTQKLNQQYELDNTNTT